jgi:hypothetical protein
MPDKINNPGGGDCGSYAFAIGLIEHIQHQARTDQNSPLFHSWQSLGLPADISLDDFKKFNLAQMIINPCHYKSELLDRLQMNLRQISFHHQFSQISNPQDLSRSSLFANFEALVNQDRGQDLSPQFNSLTTSVDVFSFANRVAGELSRLDLTSHGDSARTDAILGFLSADLFREDGSINQSSCVYQAALRITNKGVWATERELGCLAHAFKVNLMFDGHAAPERHDPNKPTLTLINQSNVHWITKLQTPLQIPQLLPQAAGMSFYSNKENYRVLRQKLLQKKFDVKIDQQIDIHQIDKAEALKGSNGQAIETDEEFAQRLQEAEIRLYRRGPK